MLFCSAVLIASLFLAALAHGQSYDSFNPNFIISDNELEDCHWTASDIQQFLVSKGSYLASYQTAALDGTIKSAAEIIYESALNYHINPKFLLVTLQKEQSLITDDSPTSKQLDWATGFGVCDSCNLNDPKVQSHKGFAKQIDDSAGIIRWYFDNENCGVVKQKDTPILIDDLSVTPGSWATAFLYTYTPHLHGNKNFWRIWSTWFSQLYPNGSLLKSASTSEVWLIQDGTRRKFKNRTALITRADPATEITVPDIELENYQVGPEIAFSNYSILRSPSGTFLLDYDTLRPFADNDVVKKFGYNPEEIIDVENSDLSDYNIGKVITVTTTDPQGIIYKTADRYYLLKDNQLHVILDKSVIDANYKQLTVKKVKSTDLSQYEIADDVINYSDGTLIRAKESNRVFVMDKGKKRAIIDDETFFTMGYKTTNIVTVNFDALSAIPQGDSLFLNSSLVSNKDKFLGDSLAPIQDVYKPNVPAYLVAEYPTGRIISGKNVDDKRPIASLTKLMTAYEALSDNFDMKKTTAYSDKKYSAPGNNVKFKTGEKIKNIDLFNSLLIGSANNIARMVAQATDASEKDFVSKMNSRLDDWGADNTTLIDVTGMDQKNISSARDLLKIFTDILKNDVIKTALGKSEYKFKDGAKSHTIENANSLLGSNNKDYRVLAGKAGYTDEAKFVLVMLVEAKKTKKQYIIVTLGDPNYNKRFTVPDQLAEAVTTNKVNITVNK